MSSCTSKLKRGPEEKEEGLNSAPKTNIQHENNRLMLNTISYLYIIKYQRKVMCEIQKPH